MTSLKGENVDDSFLWHPRYGHLNYKGMRLLEEENMVKGLPNIYKIDKFFDGCIYEKCIDSHFQSSLGELKLL